MEYSQGSTHGSGHSGVRAGHKCDAERNYICASMEKGEVAPILNHLEKSAEQKASHVPATAALSQIMSHLQPEPGAVGHSLLQSSSLCPDAYSRAAGGVRPAQCNLSQNLTHSINSKMNK